MTKPPLLTIGGDPVKLVSETEDVIHGLVFRSYDSDGIKLGGIPCYWDAQTGELLTGGKDSNRDYWLRVGRET